MPGGPDRDGARFVLLVAAAGLIAVLWPVWAVVGAVGLATTSQEQADAAFAALLETERSGWGVLGAWAAAPLAAAVACVAVAVPVASARRRTLVAAAVLAGLAAVVVALAGFSPGSAVTPPAARAAGLPAGVPLDPTWAPEGALLALALALAALGMTLARRAWPPGSANVLGGCVLLAGALALRWEVDLASGAVHRGPAFLGLLTAPYVVLGALATAAVLRGSRRSAIAALVLVVAGAGSVVLWGFTGGIRESPLAALAGLALVSLGLLGALWPRAGSLPRLVGLSGALALAAVPVLPWGPLDLEAFYGPLDEVGDPPGFTTSFDVAGSPVGPLLWLVPAGLTLWLLLGRERPRPLAASGLLLAVVLGGALTVAGDEVYASIGLSVATAGAALALLGTAAALISGRADRPGAR